MTENEVRKYIEELREKARLFGKSGYATAGMGKAFNKSADTIENLLNELESYRAIGTVEGYERAIESSIENYNLYREYKSKVQKFEAIGTIEEFKALKVKEQNYDNCHNLTCRRKCEKDGYAKAIDEFEKEIRNWQGDIQDNEHDADKFDFVFERIYEIAEEMRGAVNG